jgi:hypothetical protein
MVIQPADFAASGVSHSKSGFSRERAGDSLYAAASGRSVTFIRLAEPRGRASPLR